MGWQLSSVENEIRWSAETIDRAQLLARVAGNALASRRSKSELLDYREQVNGLFDSSSEPMFYVGPEQIVNCSMPAAARLGFESRYDLMGRPFWSLSPATQGGGLDARSKFMQLCGRSLSGLPCRFPWKFKCRDGSIHEADLTLSSVSRGDVIRFLIIINGREEASVTNWPVVAMQRELEIGKEALEERSIALRQAYRHIQEEKAKLNGAISANRDRVIVPLIAKIKQRVGPDGDRDMARLENALADITSPFVHDMASSRPALSPRELEVCALIKQGMQSKEIAAALTVSVRTVDKLRQRIRRKVGIANDDIDLGKYLRST